MRAALAAGATLNRSPSKSPANPLSESVASVGALDGPPAHASPSLGYALAKGTGLEGSMPQLERDGSSMKLRMEASREFVKQELRHQHSREAAHEAAVFDILRELDKHQIDQLHDTFMQAQDHELDESEFVSALYVGLQDSRLEEGITKADSTQLSEIFKRIDVRNAGLIKWEDFCDFAVFGRESRLSVEDIARMEVTEFNSKPRTSLPTYDEQIDRINFLPALNRFVTCHRNSLVSLWTPEGTLSRRLKGHTSSVLDCVHIPRTNDPGSGRLVSSSSDRTLVIWDDTNFAVLAREQVDVPQQCLVWCPPAKLIFSGGTDGAVRSHDVLKPKSQKIVHQSHSDWISDLLYVHDLRALVSASLDKKITLWDLHKQDYQIHLQGHKKSIYAVAYSPENKVLISGGQDRDLYIWNPYIAQPLHRVRGHEKPIIKIIMVPNSHEIITGDTSGKVKIWDIRKMSCKQTLGGRGTIEFSSPFATLTHDSISNTVVTVGRRWCFYRGIGSVNNARAAHSAVTHLLYNAEFEALLAVAGPEVSVWSVHTGEMLAAFSTFATLSDELKAEIMGAGLDPTGRILVLCALSGVVAVVNATTGDHIAVFNLVYRSEITMGRETLHFDTQKPEVHNQGRDKFTASKDGHQIVEELFFVEHTGNNRMVVGCANGYLVVLHLLPGRLLPEVQYTLHMNGNRERQVFHARALTHARQMMVVGGVARTFRVWRTDTFSLHKEERLHSDITCAVFADSVDALITSDSDKHMHVYAGRLLLHVANINMTELGSCVSLSFCNPANVLFTETRLSLTSASVLRSWDIAKLAREVNAHQDDTETEWDAQVAAIMNRSKRATDSVATGVHFSSNPLHTVLVPIEDASPYGMYTWTGLIDDVASITATQHEASLIVGFVDGTVSAFSPRGEAYGSLTRTQVDEWLFPSPQRVALERTLTAASMSMGFRVEKTSDPFLDDPLINGVIIGDSFDPKKAKEERMQRENSQHITPTLINLSGTPALRHSGSSAKLGKFGSASALPAIGGASPAPSSVHGSPIVPGRSPAFGGTTSTPPPAGRSPQPAGRSPLGGGAGASPSVGSPGWSSPGDESMDSGGGSPSPTNNTTGSPNGRSASVPPLGNLARVKKPSTRVSYHANKDRYLDALHPFYSDMLKYEEEPEPVRPFFMPRPAHRLGEVLNNARNLMATTGPHSQQWRAKQEAEDRRNETQKTIEFKQQIIAHNRLIKPARDIYRPTFSPRARRLDLRQFPGQVVVVNHRVHEEQEPNFNRPSRRHPNAERVARTLVPDMMENEGKPTRRASASQLRKHSAKVRRNVESARRVESGRRAKTSMM